MANKEKLTSILSAVRALVKQNRPAYKDYLGRETVTVPEKVICEGVFSSGDGLELRMLDTSFTGFVVGETYQVTVGDETGSYTAVELDGATGVCSFDITAGEIPDDYWAFASVDGDIDAESQGVYDGQPFSVSFPPETVTVDRYDIKKLPEDCVPDSVTSKINATGDAVYDTWRLAYDAWDLADHAYDLGHDALDTATGLLPVLEVEYPVWNINYKRGSPMSGSYTSESTQTEIDNAKAIIIKLKEGVPVDPPGNSAAIAVRGPEGYPFYTLSSNGNPVSITPMPNGMLFGEGVFTDEKLLTATRNYVDTAIAKIPSYSAGDGISIDKEGVISADNSKEIILTSSTEGSTKKFRLTVDDTGALTAVEITE